MIQNQEQKTEYETNYNKIYVPSEYVENTNKYTIDNENLTIITNHNCITSYNTTQCDCYRYNIKYNIITQSYQCNRNPNNYILKNQSITTDSNYSTRITSEYAKNYEIFFWITLIVLITTILFKRNSRNI